MFKLEDTKIAVVGLGYVGLPLAVEFSKKYSVKGFDVDSIRVSELNSGIDSTLELDEDDLKNVQNITFSDRLDDIADCNLYILTVPTPIDSYKNPDVSLLLRASEMIGSIIDENDVLIYESTVYPGATEELCVPVLEKTSGLDYNKDFFVGYSPERINPGDKEHRLTNIVKVTSGSNDEVALYIDRLYASIVLAGTHPAPSIKVAEAAKVIENTQRDVNIALINELSIIFNKLDIDTSDVLSAAGTKWNFLPFRPGLVGGHCIGVDPYYLTHKAQTLGYNPEVILAGRHINDGMGKYVVEQLVKNMIQKDIKIDDSRVLIMGLTFKENCPDLRNSKVIDIVSELLAKNIKIDIVDPWCSIKEAKDQYNLELINNPKKNSYEGIIIAVPHKEFFNMGINSIKALGKKNYVLYDLKSMFDKNQSDLRL